MSKRAALFASAAVFAGAMVVPALAAQAKEIDMCNVGVTMSDGAVMRADIARPGPGRHPTVLTVTGYNKDLGDPQGQCSSADESLTKAGFNVVVFDDRGTGSSDGVWDIWGKRTQQDYVEELHWLEHQSWQDGNIGTTGTSYLAITSLLIAETGDPHVKAVFANYPMADAYRDVTYFGGNLDTDFMPSWFGFTQGTNANPPTQLSQDGPTPAVALNAESHFVGGPAVVGSQLVAAGLTDDKNSYFAPYDGPTDRLRSPATRASKIHGAVFWTGGWYDIFQRGEPFLYRALSNASNKVWVQGPTYHAASFDQWKSTGLGSDEESSEVAWFEHYLMGTHNQFSTSTVDGGYLWNVGADKWQHATDWPLPGTQWTSYDLSSASSGSGAMSLADDSLATTRAPQPTRVLLPFQPSGGLCNRSTVQWAAGSGAGQPCETNEAPGEAGTVTFTTPPLKHAMHIAGPIVLHLRAELSHFDFSFYTALTDVDGSTSTQISSGGLDASFMDINQKQSWRNPDGQLILPWHPFTQADEHNVSINDPHDFVIEIYPTDWTLLAGHRLRLVVGSADTPHFQVPADRLQTMLGGTAQILTGGRDASTLLLPVQPA
jgi:uncharacterized protein